MHLIRRESDTEQYHPTQLIDTFDRFCNDVIAEAWASGTSDTIGDVYHHPYSDEWTVPPRAPSRQAHDQDQSDKHEHSKSINKQLRC